MSNQSQPQNQEKPHWIAGIIIVILAAIAPPLVSHFGWLFAGHVYLGLTVGLLIGMSKSAVVSSVLPLLFTFAGGSIVTLSIGEHRTPEQLQTLGTQLVGLGLGSIIGLLVGVFLRDKGLELQAGKLRD